MDANHTMESMRIRLGFKTQGDLAKAIRVSVATISSMENGKRRPSYEVTYSLFELGATVQEIFGIDYDKIQSRQLEKPSIGNTVLTIDMVQDMIASAIARDRLDRSKAVG